MSTITSQTAHFLKYEALYNAKNGKFLHWLVPATKEQIEEALNAGDEPLNTIPLHKWDIAAVNIGWTSEDSKGKKYASLAEQVCLLKHIARHHIAFK